jgi:glycosyltransferase involved in cell wall biosynthesis
MRIAHIITRMVHGGAQINTLMCAVEQARQGHDVTLVTGVQSGSEGSILEQAHRSPIRVIEVPPLVRELNPLLDLVALNRLYRLLGEGYDIVHTHTSKAGILGRAAARARKVPIIVHTSHGHVFHSFFHPWKARLFVALERIAARWCDRLVMLTEGELRDHLAEKIAPPEMFTVIPSGVDLSPFPRRASLPQDSTVVGTVLRLVAIKGVLDLLDAFALVHQALPSARLVIAGDGPLRAEVQAKVVKLGLQDQVSLLGHVEPGSVLPTYDVFVMPSHNEGMGRAVVEAMATGLPIVATEVGGLPDLVENGLNGLLVPPREPRALAKAIEKLLREPQTAWRMGEASYERSREFTEQVMFERLGSLYQSLALERAGKRFHAAS